MYKNGNIFWGDEIKNRLYNLLDYSNYFRFTTNILIILMFQRRTDHSAEKD